MTPWLLAQATETEGVGQVIRESDGRIAPLVFVLIALGVGALLSTGGFWWMTRPKRHHHGVETEDVEAEDGALELDDHDLEGSLMTADLERGEDDG